MIKRILMQGDSITDMNRNKDNNVNYMMGGGYATMTAGRMTCDYPERDLEFINRGISGNRIVDLYARWKVDAINLNPDLISILIGINDTWHEAENQNGVDLERFEQVYRMLIDWTLKALPEVKIVLLEPFFLNFGQPALPCWADHLYEIPARAAIVRQIASDYSLGFVPLQDGITKLAGRCVSPSHVLIDGVHPSSAGAQFIADRLCEELRKYL